MFIANWLDVFFVHFRIDPARLAPLVPLPLDLCDGEAYVSLVAFTQSNLRPTFGGRLGRLLLVPLAHHEFLNIRTYVRHGDDAGIFFIAEWIPNRLAALVGPRTYGLPYRLGRLKYDGMRREIKAAGRGLAFEARRGTGASPVLAAPAAGRRECMGEAREAPMPQGSATGEKRDHFLLERYSAFTSRNGIIRRFDVRHVPWPQRRIDVDLLDTSLLQLSGDWFDHAKLAAAHYSPGVRDVIIGRPRRVLRASHRRRLRA